jgi:hypothetical protein
MLKCLGTHQLINAEFCNPKTKQWLPSVDCADLEKWKLIAAFCLTKKDGWRKTLEKKLIPTDPRFF